MIQVDNAEQNYSLYRLIGKFGDRGNTTEPIFTIEENGDDLIIDRRGTIYKIDNIGKIYRQEIKFSLIKIDTMHGL